MLVEDFPAFLDPTGLGNAGTIGGVSVNGVFEWEYVDISEVEGYFPTFLVEDAHAQPVVIRETVVSLKGIDFVVISRRPDGTGLTLMVLEKT